MRIILIGIGRDIYWRIIIERNKIKKIEKLIKIWSVTAKMRICGDRHFRIFKPYRKHCIPYKIRRAVRCKPIPVKAKRRILPCLRIIRRRLNLGNTAVFSAPNAVSESLVYAVEIVIFIYQPISEFPLAYFAAARISFEFVVYLPCRNSRLSRIMTYHLLGNALCIRAEYRRVYAAMTTYSGTDSVTVASDLNNFGIFLIKPQRRTVCRRT